MAPLVCAVANAVAAIALATVLAPGTPLGGDVAERAAYVREHALAWRLGWATWMVAAATLLWFYAWWGRRVGAGAAPLAIAFAGIVPDWAAELSLIAAPDRYAEIAPLAFVLTGGAANFAYTVAGIQLTRASPLGPLARAYSAFMWSAGLVLSLGALAQLHAVTAIGTALLFVTFVPWCVYVRWRLGP